MRPIVLITVASLIPAIAPAQETWLDARQEVDYAEMEHDGDGFFGFRFMPNQVRIELLNVPEEIAASGLLDNGLFPSQSSGLQTLTFSLAELWTTLEAQGRTPLGLISAGYLEQASVPRVAGLVIEDGVLVNDFFNAPNMTSVLCLDAPVRREQSNFDRDPGIQFPYLLEVDFFEEGAYTIAQDNSLIENTILNDQTQVEIFSSCVSGIQVGPRIIEPRGIGAQLGITGRWSEQVLSDRYGEQVWNVAAWDLNGAFTFYISLERVSLLSFAEFLSDRSLYPTSPSVCDGADDRFARSQSCEYWATVVATFGSAGIIVPREQGGVDQFGDVDVLTPYAFALYPFEPPED